MYIDKQINRIYHLIDFEEIGTIYNLINPLCREYDNHKLLTPLHFKSALANNILREINSIKDSHIVIHTTGKNDSFFLNNFQNLFPDKEVNIFMHVSYEYLRFKNRDREIIHSAYSQNSKRSFFVPSEEVAQQYRLAGISCKTIQLGIPEIQDNKDYKRNIPKLEEFYDKIITTCVRSTDLYKYIKGIDTFEKIIKKNKLEEHALITGIDDQSYGSIKSKYFTQEDFLNVLYHSKMYLQFSRFESYNITAVQAKRMRIPVLLLDSEGNSSCMKGDVYSSEEELEQELFNILRNKVSIKKIEANYKDSIERENLFNFKQDLEQNLVRDDL
jgi:hypothetical protein